MLLYQEMNTSQPHTVRHMWQTMCMKIYKCIRTQYMKTYMRFQIESPPPHRVLPIHLPCSRPESDNVNHAIGLQSFHVSVCNSLAMCSCNRNHKLSLCLASSMCSYSAIYCVDCTKAFPDSIHDVNKSFSYPFFRQLLKFVWCM